MCSPTPLSHSFVPRAAAGLSSTDQPPSTRSPTAHRYADHNGHLHRVFCGQRLCAERQGLAAAQAVQPPGEAADAGTQRSAAAICLISGHTCGGHNLAWCVCRVARMPRGWTCWPRRARAQPGPAPTAVSAAPAGHRLLHDDRLALHPVWRAHHPRCGALKCLACSRLGLSLSLGLALAMPAWPRPPGPLSQHGCLAHRGRTKAGCTPCQAARARPATALVRSRPCAALQVREGADFVSRLQTENLWVVVLEKSRQGLG